MPVKTLWIDFWNDQRGFVISAELVLISTVLVIGMMTGLVCLQAAVVGELQQVGGAISSMDQSYFTTGFRGCLKPWGRTSWTAASGWQESGRVVQAGYGADIGVGVGVAPNPCLTLPAPGTETLAPAVPLEAIPQEEYRVTPDVLPCPTTPGESLPHSRVPVAPGCPCESAEVVSPSVSVPCPPQQFVAPPVPHQQLVW